MTSDVAVEWRQLPAGLRRLRRAVLAAVLGPTTLVAALVLGAAGGPAAALGAVVPAAALGAGWVLIGRSWRAWRYALRQDDVLLSRGVMWHEETVVPYGRMQLIEVSSGPLMRRFGLARLQLHTAAAATDASIPGLTPSHAVELRDRLAELGEARAAGL